MNVPTIEQLEAARNAACGAAGIASRFLESISEPGLLAAVHSEAIFSGLKKQMSDANEDLVNAVEPFVEIHGFDTPCRMGSLPRSSTCIDAAWSYGCDVLYAVETAFVESMLGCKELTSDEEDAIIKETGGIDAAMNEAISWIANSPPIPDDFDIGKECAQWVRNNISFVKEVLSKFDPQDGKEIIPWVQKECVKVCKALRSQVPDAPGQLRLPLKTDTNPLETEADRAIMAIASAGGLSSEEKARRILILSADALSWKSAKWGQVLGISANAVRGLSFWKKMQSQKHKPD